MRTTKRFTPKVLERFERTGRGQGTFSNYIPWHRVSRGDPASKGRSHLQMLLGRQHELLSDGEWCELLFASMLPNLVDALEQKRLMVLAAAHELSAYVRGYCTEHFPGTLALAESLGIKYPMVRDVDDECEWKMTTDLLLVLKKNSVLELLAVAFKQADEIKEKRKIELLRIEQAYWAARGVRWLLITPNQYDLKIALTLRNSMPWALGQQVPVADREFAAEELRRCAGCSLTLIVNVLEASFGCKDHAQRAFWQAVWSGRIPMDLRRSWRPHLPIILLTSEEFWAQNPIAARRSAWN